MVLLSLKSVFPVSTPVISSAPASDSSVQSWVSPWLTGLAYPLLRHGVLPSFFGPITVTGQHHLPTSGPVILAPTHRSRWDALMVPYATGRHVTGRDVRFMVTADEMTGVQGWFIRRLGGFPVNPRQPAIASLRFGIDILQQGGMMVMFPEGAIHRDHELRPLKPGLARLALQAANTTPTLNVQIVPIDLQYVDRTQRPGTPVVVSIGAPLAVQDYCPATWTSASLKHNAQALTQDLTIALQQLIPPPAADAC